MMFLRIDFFGFMKKYSVNQPPEGCYLLLVTRPPTGSPELVKCYGYLKFVKYRDLEEKYRYIDEKYEHGQEIDL